MNIFQRIFDAIKHLVQRPGLKTFLVKYQDQALVLIADLAAIHDNKGFRLWQDEAFAKLKADTGEIHDNWIAILIHLAYESYKAQRAGTG